MSDWANITVTAILGLGGLYIGQSIRRKTRAEIESAVAERRLSAYFRLWEHTKDAAPMRREDAKPFDADRRSALYDELTDWYFEAGNGLVLGEDTRGIYLTAKKNLICGSEALSESSKRMQQVVDSDAPGYPENHQNTRDKEDDSRASLSTRQLSLLRTSMRADLLVYSGPWGQKLSKDERAFLKECGVRTWRRPWRRTLREALGLGLTNAPPGGDLPTHRDMAIGSHVTRKR